jgi:hypothetical protein
MSFEKLGFHLDIFISIIICIGFYLVSVWNSIKYRDKYLKDKLEWHQAKAAKRKIKFSNKYKQRRLSYLTLTFGVFWIVFYLIKPSIKNVIDYL